MSDQKLDSSTENNFETMSFEERMDFFNNTPVIDVSNGMDKLFHNADELSEMIIRRLDKGQSRFPIFVMKDGRILLVGGKNTRFQHKSILDHTGLKESDVSSSTSLEGIDSNIKPSEPHLVLDTHELGEMKIPIGKGSDLYVPGLPSSKDGRDILEKIFGNIEGVHIVTPGHWK